MLKTSETLAASPFHGADYRKMRAAGLLAPVQAWKPPGPRNHDGPIVT